MIFMLAGLFVFSGSAYAATDKTLTVGSGSGVYGATVSVPITIDNPAGVGGAAFTLTYNSTIFDFVELEQDVKVISNGDEYKTGSNPDVYTVTDDQKTAVSNTLFYQVNDEPSNRVLVAGASAKELTNAGLFKAKFLIKDGVPEGTYPIGLNRTIILNADAGYDTSTFIPALVGMPAMEANAQGYYETPVFTTTLVNGSITVNAPADSLFTISGNVTYGTASGDQAADGTPVVLKKLTDSVYVYKAQTTVSGGSYSFADNLAGDYRVFVTSNDPNFYNNSADVTVAEANVDADVVLPAPMRVSGTVTINGVSIAGLKVKVMNGDQVMGIYAVNDDGTYQSGPLPPGTYTAYAVYGSLTTYPVELTDGYNWEETLYTINGTVSGLPADTVATITASSANGQMMKTVTSSAENGTYTISNLVPADDYIVSAVATGLPVIYFDRKTAFTEATPVDIPSDIPSGNATANFDYTAVTQGTISGTIYEGNINDNTVPGIGVFAFNVNTYALVSVVTNNSGEYALTLSPGSYELFVIKDSGTVFYYDAGSFGDVNQNETKADILEVTEGGALTGKSMNVIECEETLTGKVTYELSDGSPVAFALITATSGDKRTGTITGVDGRYTLSGLCDGLVYTVEMDPQAGNYGIQTETITAGTDTTLNFIIDTGHVLSGTVKDSVSGDGIANATIYLRDQETNALVGGRMYFSEAGGGYSIRDIPTGIYALVASHPLYRTCTEANVLIEGDTSKDIPLVQGAHFLGTVLDGSNGDVPLGGVLIIVTRAGSTPVYAVTNSTTGDYSVYGLDATKSDYIILAQKRGYVRQVKVGQLPAIGAGTAADFTLVYPAALFDLSGVITSDCGDGGTPVTNALVVVSSTTAKFFSSTRTDGSGAYSFQNLPQASDYRFVIVPGGSLQVHVETGLDYLTNGATEYTHDVTLPCGSEISGAITWTGTGTAYVLLYTAGNEFVDFTTVDVSGGTYTFAGLADGTYKVLAFASGNTPKWYDGETGIVDADPVTVPGAVDIDITLTQ